MWVSPQHDAGGNQEEQQPAPTEDACISPWCPDTLRSPRPFSTFHVRARATAACALHRHPLGTLAGVSYTEEDKRSPLLSSWS